MIAKITLAEATRGGGCFARFFEANFQRAEAKWEAIECEASALTTELTAPETKLLLPVNLCL